MAKACEYMIRLYYIIVCLSVQSATTATKVVMVRGSLFDATTEAVQYDLNKLGFFPFCSWYYSINNTLIALFLAPIIPYLWSIIQLPEPATGSEEEEENGAFLSE